MGAGGGSGVVSVTIPVGISGVTSAFTWLNTENGQPGPEAYLYVTFHWANGSATAALIGDVNVTAITTTMSSTPSITQARCRSGTMGWGSVSTGRNIFSRLPYTTRG
jgi:hypothetical protein